MRSCPRCRFMNAPQKNYCDQCDAPIGLRAANASGDAPPAAATQPAAPKPAGLPAAGRNLQSFTPPPSSPTVPPPPIPTATREAPRGIELFPSGALYFFKSVLALLALAAIAIAAYIIFLNWRQQFRPEVLVVQLAERYLALLKDGNYPAAYRMLTAAAREGLSMEDFGRLRNTTPWTYSGIRILKVEPDAVLIGYDLAVQGRPTAQDTLLFIRDGRDWARPYNWHVVKEIESAFEKGDADLALILSQKAVHINPRDAMARGYLCEALYYRKVWNQIETECRRALDMHQKYPSKLSPKSLYHLHAILGDTYKNALRRPKDAVAQYDLMLAFPNISREDQCELILARAEAHEAAGDVSAAISDIDFAAPLCTRPEDAAFIKRKRPALAGRLR